MLARRYLDRPIIWEAALDVLPLSTGANSTALRAALAAMGITFTRASSATVQTGASTVVTSGIGVDDPRVGDAGYGRGLVIEEARSNSLLWATDVNAWNNVATASVGNDTITAPNGAAGDVLNTPVAGDGRWSAINSATVSGAASFTRSVWLQSDNGAAGTILLKDPIYAGSVLVANTGTTWARIIQPETVLNGGATGAGVYIQRQGAGTNAATRVWGAQTELGKFATELILTTGAAATRQADVLSTPTWLVRDGRLGLELRFVAKAAPTSFGGTFAIWSDSNTLTNSIVFSHTTGQAVIRRNGAIVMSGGAGASWAAGDVVDLWCEYGGTSLQTIVRYRVNGGARVTLNTAAAAGAISPAGSYLMNAAGAYNTSAWVQRVRAYAPDRRPAWAA